MKTNLVLLFTAASVLSSALISCAYKDENGFPIDLKTKNGQQNTLQKQGPDANGETFDVDERPETDYFTAKGKYQTYLSSLLSLSCSVNQNEIPSGNGDGTYIYQTDVGCAALIGPTGLSKTAEQIRALIRISIAAKGYSDTALAFGEKNEHARYSQVVGKAAEEAARLKKVYDANLKKETESIANFDKNYYGLPNSCKIKDRILFCSYEQITNYKELKSLESNLIYYRNEIAGRYAYQSYGKRLAAEIQRRQEQYDVIIVAVQKKVAEKVAQMKTECEDLRSKLTNFLSELPGRAGKTLVIKNDFSTSCNSPDYSASFLTVADQILKIDLDVLKTKAYGTIEITWSSYDTTNNDDLDLNVPDEKLTARLTVGKSVADMIAKLPDINATSYQTRLSNQLKISELKKKMSNDQSLKVELGESMKSLAQAVEVLSSFPYDIQTLDGEASQVSKISFKKNYYDWIDIQINLGENESSALSVRIGTSSTMSSAIVAEVEKWKDRKAIYKYLKIKPEFESLLPKPPTLPTPPEQPVQPNP